jgi:uncharacterized membrane protein YkgB
MFGHSKKNGGYCTSCTILNLVVGVVAALVSLAALVGVWKSHVLSSGLTFGTTSGSLSIMALALSLFLLKKAMAACFCQCGLPAGKK